MVMICWIAIVLSIMLILCGLLAIALVIIEKGN